MKNNYIPVYHGSKKEFDKINKNSFFSTNFYFAKDYGDNIKAYALKEGNCFDATDRELITIILEHTALYSEYDDIEINSWEDYLKCTNHLSDTWEVIEDSIEEIISIYENIFEETIDTFLISEGGVTNYLVFNPSISTKEIMKVNEENIRELISNIDTSIEKIVEKNMEPFTKKIN